MVHYTFDIDGRSINIIYTHIDPDILIIHHDLENALNEQIVKTSRKYPLSSFLPTINFLFYDSSMPEAPKINNIPAEIFNSDNSFAFVLPTAHDTDCEGCLIRSSDTIYVNMYMHDALMKAAYVESISGAVIHEIAHLVHDQKSRYSGTIDAWSRVLKGICPFMIPGSTMINNILYMRWKLSHLMERVIAEGMGRYAEEFCLLDEVCMFTPEVWKQNYAKALSSVGYICKILEQYSEFVESYFEAGSKHSQEMMLSITDSQCVRFEKVITDTNTSYNIGMHIIHTILYHDKTVDFEDLLSLSYPQILRRYEECMKKAGEKALVSYTSGKGYLDYSTWLRRLNEVYETARKTGY